MISKSVSQIFKILFQPENIDIFVLPCVSFSRYVQLKSFYSDEKISAVKSGTHFSTEAIVEKVEKILSSANNGALKSCSYCKTTLITLMGMCL